MPLLVKLIELAVQACHASNTGNDTCIANMIPLGFFFFCCSGVEQACFNLF